MPEVRAAQGDAATRTFGIDLGTTHSCIAYVDDAGKPVIVKSAIGEDTTPSVVYFEAREQVIVGSAAKNSAVLAPHLVAQLIKREMGRRDASFSYQGRKYTPEAISALILRELVRATKENTGMTVRDVVITVPAYFGVAEREATRRAGKIAGLDVLDVLPEPVAAALHYQTLNKGPDVRHVLVCDLGGGTFDTTVIRLDGDDVRVVCTDGDPKLGGADWDTRISEYLLDAFTEQHPRLDPTADDEFMQDLAGTAEDLKKTLSSTLSRRTDLRFRGAVARLELTRTKLEELTSDLLDRVVEITERTIDVARSKGIQRFDEVLLVGGMTRMPAVAERLKDCLHLDARLHEPDLAVAKGAALFAVIKKIKVGLPDDSAGGRSISRADAARVADQLGVSTDQVEAMAAKRVTTVVPRGFGVRGLDPNDPLSRTNPMAARQMVVHLLPANTPLPADTGPYPFMTSMENQRMVEIEVWEQSGPVASEELADNTRIGRGLLRDLPARRPAGSLVEVTFFMSETGTLTVHAQDPESRREVRFDLEIGGMDQAKVDAARTGIARHDVSG